LAVFYNIIDDYIYISPTNDTISSGLNIFKFSQTNAKLYGSEIGLHFHPKIIPCLHIQSNFSSVIGEQENGNYLPFIPAHKIKSEIRYEKEKLIFLKNVNFKIASITAFTQNHFSVFETQTSAYTIFNVSLSANVKLQNQLLNIGLSANNILDKAYFDHLSTLKSLNIYNTGRNFSITLKIPFQIK
jgi:iron complex outermembrane receptor protein